MVESDLVKSRQIPGEVPALIDEIRFQHTKDVPVADLRSLFLTEHWCDYMNEDEVAFYLKVALHVVTAWQGGSLVGFGRLEGDGRISVEISDVLVRSDFQGQGVGTELVRRLVDHICELDPYYIQVNPIGDREVHLYEKFGFREMSGYRKMELVNPKLARKISEVRNQ